MEKQLQYLSTSESTIKRWYIQTVEYYSAPKINQFSSYEITWRKLECILLSGSCLSEKHTYYMISTIRLSGKGKAMETKENRKKKEQANTQANKQKIDLWLTGVDRREDRRSRIQGMFTTVKLLCMILI